MDPSEEVVAATLSLFEGSRLPMWIYSLQTLAFLAVNDAAADFYGYTREELLAVTVRQLHLPADAPGLPHLERMPLASEPKETWRHIKKDGTVVYVDRPCTSPIKPHV